MILESGNVETAQIAGAATVVQTDSDVWKGISGQAPSFSFQSEASAVADDTPTFAQPAITVYTARSFIPVSIELDQDYPQIVENLTAAFSRGWADTVANVSAQGSGSGEPTGLFTAMAANDHEPGSRHRHDHRKDRGRRRPHRLGEPSAALPVECDLGLP